MTHQCRIDGSSAVCIEVDGKLWVKEHADSKQREGRTYAVSFCPECGFKLPTKSFFNFLHLPYTEVDDSIHKFSAELGKSISEMNHNIALIKAFMSAQNVQNECFMDRDFQTSQDIFQLKNRIEKLETMVTDADD